MSTQVQIRRGNTAQTSTFTGVVAELTVDTTKNTVIVHDGSTAGGFALARESALSSNATFSQAAFTQANAAFLQANTPSYTANSAASYSNSSFGVANSASSYANSGFITANSAGVYANSAFAAANAATATDATQNTNITSAATYANSAFLAANTPSYIANSAAAYANAAFATANTVTSASSYANSAFLTANTPSYTANSAAAYANAAFATANTISSAGSYANAAFTRANNSINANTGGTIAGDLSITGNLTVTGLTTYSNTTTVLIADNIITVNAAINQAAQPTVNAGIEVDRGIQPNSSILWIETSGKWSANNGNGTIFIAADSAESYANAAFAKANNEGGVNATQNTNITNAGTYANSAFLNANSAFIRANNSLNANTGGTIAGQIAVDGGVYGNVTITQFASVYGQGFGPNPYSVMQVRSSDNISGLGMQAYTGSGVLYGNTAISFVTGATIRDKDVYAGGINAGQFAANGAFIALASLASTSNSTGSIQVVGGVGVKGNVYADAVYDGGVEIIAYANTIFLAANTPSHVANSAASYANAAFVSANTADAKAVTAGSYANSAFAVANNGVGIDTTQNTNITSAASYANSAFAAANTSASAGSYANSAFGVANTDVTNINITTGTYGNSAYYPVITVSANGRINVVTTQVVTDPSAIAFAIALG